MKKYLLLFLLLALCVSTSFTQTQINKSLGYELELIGSPVKSLPYLMLGLAEPDKGLESDIIINSFNPKAAYFARYNHVIGKASIHQLANSTGLWGMTHYGKDKVYLGGCTKSQLYEYDVKSDKVNPVFTGALETNSLGWVLGENYVWSLAESKDGKIYGTTYPTCKLFSYNPKTRVVEDFGQMAEGEMYARNVCTDFPGKVYVGVGTHAKLVEFDIETKMKRQILPKKYQDQSIVYNVVRFQNYLVAVVTPGPFILFFDPVTRDLVKEFDMSKYDYGFYQFNPIAYHDKLYFGMMIKGDLYSIDKDLNIKMEMKDAGAPFALAQDRYLYCVNALKKFNIVDLKDNKIVKSFFKNIEGPEGNSIFALNNGPEGKIYGSGFINQHLFVFDQGKKSFKDLGPAANFPGQINALIGFEDKVYIGHYVYARFSEYDPLKGWEPGFEKRNNPNIFESVGNEQDKILDMDKDKNYVYCATSPTYGKSGGCLTILDPKTKKIESFRNVIKDQALRVLRVLKDGNLAIGSETGYIEQKDSAAVFMIWDPIAKKEVFSLRPLVKSGRIIGIAQVDDKNICFSADSTFFVFDYANKKIKEKIEPGYGLIYRMICASDGYVYAVAKRAIIKYDIKTNKIDKLFDAEGENFVNFVIEDKDKRIFLAINQNIFELKKTK